jgi:hypothetical protein
MADGEVTGLRRLAVPDPDREWKAGHFNAVCLTGVSATTGLSPLGHCCASIISRSLSRVARAAKLQMSSWPALMLLSSPARATWSTAR